MTGMVMSSGQCMIRHADMYHYDGYIADEGNKEQIDNENVPFVTTTGSLDNDAVPCMVLFTQKGEQIIKTAYVGIHYGTA